MSMSGQLLSTQITGLHTSLKPKFLKKEYQTTDIHEQGTEEIVSVNNPAAKI